MKNLNKTLLAVTIAVGFTAINHARADEALLSPRAREQADSLKKVPRASTKEFDLVYEIRAKNGTPKSKDQWSSLSSWVLLYTPRNDRDLVGEMRGLSGSPKMQSQQQNAPMRK